MNFSKSKVLLKKINAIHDSGLSFEEKLSPLERDLLLQYIRDLYECVLQENQDNTTIDSIAPVKQAPVNEVTPEAGALKETQKPDHRSEPIESFRPSENTNNSFTAPVKEVKKEQKKKSKDSDLEALFINIQTDDLAQRFANSPIKDVSRAMGINERILTINELFKGDQKDFQEVVGKLNSMSTFDDAKQYLIGGVASRNNWSNEKNRQKAEVFVKLVRRRFL